MSEFVASIRDQILDRQLKLAERQLELVNWHIILVNEKIQNERLRARKLKSMAQPSPSHRKR